MIDFSFVKMSLSKFSMNNIGAAIMDGKKYHHCMLWVLGMHCSIDKGIESANLFSLN